ncbi:hypothetical protein BDY17DRAFT_327137 [Neohortaea acidophila]|uniref:Secreted protein n=1 Tax=Neohortaea acidophila TaxID=245834 RepID=A0A6A6PK31_9PEZI|nr:uncharacterized protein BDY17DRAFT_327137 [Neohortaea acidophila]KAF2480156.1 hypothetical protein BDY17DRAFT_327137 [Neohortaea acidophila]
MAAISVYLLVFAASRTTSTTTSEIHVARLRLGYEHDLLSRLCPEIINQIFTSCIRDTEIHIGEFEDPRNC